MKNHIIVKLKREIPGSPIPPWIEHIQTSLDAPDKAHPGIDKLLKKYEIPVKYTSEYSPKDKEIWSKEEINNGLNRTYRLILKKNTNIPQDLIQSIRLIPDVEYARAGDIGLSDLPDMLSQPFGRKTDMESREMVRLPDAHAVTKGNPAVKVAVLDTGIDTKHPELRKNLLPGFDFVNIIDGASRFIGDYIGFDTDPTDYVGHGTHVAGIIAGLGIKMPEGIAPKVRILPVRVLGAMKKGKRRVGAGLVDNINTAIKWAVDKKADVINMSLGVRHLPGKRLPHEEVVNYAKSKGVTIVAASGNDGSENVYYPSGHSFVITVGASDETGRVAQFSTFGEHVDFIAPGTNIYSTYLNGTYAFSSGTSHASPFVTGAIALLKSRAYEKGYGLSDKQCKHILKNSSDKLGKSFKNRLSGYGMINLRDALRLLDYKLH